MGNHHANNKDVMDKLKQANQGNNVEAPKNLYDTNILIERGI